MTEASPAPIVLPAVGDDVTVAESPLRRFAALWVLLACLIVAFIAIQPALRGEAWIWTDKALVRDNTFLLRPAGLASLWTGIVQPSTYPLPQYSPLTQTTFFLDRLIWGSHPWGYRITTAVLHALTGLMLFQLLSKLRVRGASIIAILFVAHPIAIESVAWLTERRNVLAALFGLASTYLALRAAGTIAPPPDDAKFKPLPPEPGRLLALAAVVQVLGLFAHPSIALLPGVVLLIAWWKRTRPDTRLAASCGGLIVVGLVLAVLNGMVERGAVPGMANHWQRDVTPIGEFVTRVQLAGRAVLTYAAKTVVPYPMSIDSGRPLTPADAQWFAAHGGAAVVASGADVGPENALAWIAPIVVIGLLVAAWVKRDQIGRGPLAALGAFVLVLAPSLGFITLGWMSDGLIADRAAYLAVAVLLAGIVGGIARLTRTSALLNAAFAVAGLALIVGIGLSRSRAGRFVDELGFWRTTLQISPRSVVAIEQLTAAEIVSPDGSDETTARRITDALKFRPHDPRLLVAYATLLSDNGQVDAALNWLKQAIQDEPTYAPAYAMAGQIFREQANDRPNDRDVRLNSQEALQRAVTLDPRDVFSRLLLAEANTIILSKIGPDHPSAQGLLDDSVRLLDEATALRPYDSLKLLFAARQLLQLGKVSDAGTRLEVAKSIDPKNPEVYILTGEAFEKSGNPQPAESSYQQALTLDPQSVRALLHLAALRQNQERWDAAREALVDALRIRPDSTEGKARLADVEAHRQTTWPPPSTMPTTAPTTQSTTRPATLPAAATQPR